MVLVSDISADAVRRMRLLAETNQMLQERIEYDRKQREEQDEASSDSEEQLTVAGDEAGRRPAALRASESFVEFLDKSIDFMTPKSKTQSELTARNAYLMANAKVSEVAYDAAVEKCRHMSLLRHVSFASELDTVLPAEGVEPAMGAEGVEEEAGENALGNSLSMTDCWWRNVLYIDARNLGTPKTPALMPAAVELPELLGLPRTPKTPTYGEWKI